MNQIDSASFHIQSECRKYGPEKLRVRTVFTHCLTSDVKAIRNSKNSNFQVMSIARSPDYSIVSSIIINSCSKGFHIITDLENFSEFRHIFVILLKRTPLKMFSPFYHSANFCKVFASRCSKTEPGLKMFFSLCDEKMPPVYKQTKRGSEIAFCYIFKFQRLVL